MNSYLTLELKDVYKFKHIGDYIRARILNDFPGYDITEIYNCGSMDSYTDTLSDLYPRGIKYDNVIWSYDDIDWILFCLDNDRKMLKVKKC